MVADPSTGDFEFIVEDQHGRIGIYAEDHGEFMRGVAAIFGGIGIVIGIGIGLVAKFDFVGDTSCRPWKICPQPMLFCSKSR